MGGQHGIQFVPDTPDEGALPVERPDETRAGGDGLHGRGERLDIRRGTELARGNGFRQQRADRPALGLVHGEGPLVQFGVREIHAQERQMMGEGLLAGLAGDGLPVPAPVATEGGDLVAEFDGHGYYVLSWVDGRHVPGTELTLDQARELGVLLARLHHALSRHAPGPLPDRPPPAEVTGVATADSAAGALRARLPADPMPGLDTALRERRALLTRYADRRPDGEIPAGPYGWTHGDFQYRNLLRRDGEVAAILDWDRLGVRPYGEEVARTAQVQFGGDGVFDLDRVAAFTAGYRSVIDLPEADLADAVTRLWWKRLTDYW